MISILLCLSFLLTLQLLSPYWLWIMIVPFAYGISGARSGWKAARTGFLSAGLLWAGWSAYLYLTGSRKVAGRMAAVLGLGHSWLMILLTAIVAAVAAAVSGFAGFSVKSLFKKSEPARKT